MEDLIHAILEQSKHSWKIYEEMQKKLARSVTMTSSDCVNYQVIANNCIQMAAVNWCKVFAQRRAKHTMLLGWGLTESSF